MEVIPELVVDTTRGQKMRINFDITIHKIPCEFLTLDVMDVSGEHQSDIDHDIFKVRLRLDGTPVVPSPKKEEKIGDQSEETAALIKQATELPPDYCGSCYGAPPPPSGCCNTCEDVRNAYRRNGWTLSKVDDIEQCKRDGWVDRLKNMDEGCRLYGHVEVNKVAGNIHVAPGKSFQQQHMHVHDLNPFMANMGKFSTSHKIHRLSFGTEFPDIINPLDDLDRNDRDEPIMYQYFVKVVPTRYNYLNGTELDTNQFSVTQHEKLITPNSQGLPGVFFQYDISPMLVIYTQTHKSFLHFLTGVCAIVGGIFTVAGLFDSFIYSAERTLKKKIELGKAS